MKPLRPAIAAGVILLVFAASGCSKKSSNPILPGTNTAPSAQGALAAGSPDCGDSLVSLVSAGSDADGSIVLYQWDFENDGSIDWSSATADVATHAYAIGAHTARHVVTDDRGDTGSNLVSFTLFAAETVFVSKSTGFPGAPGTRAQPVSKISDGLTLAALKGTPCATMLVSSGTYVELPAIGAGVTIRGGYDATTWTRIPGAYTVVTGNVVAAVCQGILVAATTISGFEFRALDAPSSSYLQRVESSIALRISDADEHLQFVDCRFIAGNGANAAPVPGANGRDATVASGPGLVGEDGTTASCGGSPSFCGGNGGTGGHAFNYAPGGAGGCGGGCSVQDAAGTAGAIGSTQSPPGALGGIGGSGSTTCPGSWTNGADGDDGIAGADGAVGQLQASFGSYHNLLWYPADGNNGADGKVGGGGGGGGGGGAGRDTATCAWIAGAGGGGGGSGGARGEFAKGGIGGGASFAVLLVNATPGFEDCTFTTANGGNGTSGGDGGRGVPGWPGAAGGSGFGLSGNGGHGGNGAEGGDGGGGSGGPGGPSVGIFQFNPPGPPTVVNCTFNLGSAGLGGQGGFTGRNGVVKAPNGPNGPRADVWP